MDEKVVVDMLLLKLYSVIDITRALNMHFHLRKLELFVRHTEGSCQFLNQAAEMLNLAFHQAEHVIEEYEFFTLRKQFHFLSSKSSKVSGFIYCRLGPFAYRIRMCLEIQELVKNLDKISHHMVFYKQMGFGGFSSAHRERALMHTWPSVRCSDVVGRDIDRDIVVEMLLTSGNEATLFVFPIVGVGGIGKTTLTKLVYNDPRIVSHFQLSLWVPVSGVLKVEKVLEQIVTSVREKCENLDVNELQNLVREALYEMKYLIVLDDVWNEDPMKWDELKKSLMVGACGSKILVTTRNEAVALVMGTIPAYCLKGLSSEDCLTLFSRKAFELGLHVPYPYLIGIASDIVQKCEGNPLLLMILGSSLRTETDRWEWNKVNNHDMWNSNQNDKILLALRVSYERLPSTLKVCLAYCSIFPKGCVIEIDKLIQLWVAEGLISKSSESEDLEHIGIQYFQELWLRSFFQDVEEYRSVYTSICKLHDLVHDLVLSAAGVEFCRVESHMQNISDEVRRVAFSDYDSSGMELPASLVSNSALRTISFSVDGVGPMSTIFVENCIARFIQLRVLDLSDSCFAELPSSVGELKYLRYLDISANDSIKDLPDSISKLLSLQTLRVSRCPQLEGLPMDIGHLISLIHLHITTKQTCFPDKAIGCLSSLRSLYIHSCKNLVSLSKGLQHLTSLRTLAIIGCPRLTFFPTTMKHLTSLENLLIVDCEELTLLEWQDIEGLRMLRSLVIGGLPELESKDVQCLGNLQMLVLAGLPQLVTLPRWLEGSNATLQYLRVERCPSFAALPKWLENLTALEKLEISKCHKPFSLPEGMSCLTNLKVLQIDY
ncbi:unnamed protein product [Withania somnifera]